MTLYGDTMNYDGLNINNSIKRIEIDVGLMFSRVMGFPIFFSHPGP